MKKKIWGAVLSCLGFSLYFLFLLSFILWAQFLAEDKMPLGLFLFLTVLLLLPLIGVVAALISRIREVKKGEEEEAKIY